MAEKEKIPKGKILYCHICNSELIQKNVKDYVDRRTNRMHRHMKKQVEQARKEEREKIFKIVRKQYGTHSSHTYTDMVELLERKEGGKQE